MNTKTLLAVAAFAGIILCPLAADLAFQLEHEEHATRAYQRGGTNYTARFTYQTGRFTTPLVYGVENQAHYDAVADLWAGDTLLATNIPCRYTEKGCFEDSLDALLSRIPTGTNGSVLFSGTNTNDTFFARNGTNLFSLSELKSVLNEIAPYLDMAQPLPDFTLVDRSPAMQLRYDADRLEQTEAMKARFKALLEKVNRFP